MKTRLTSFLAAAIFSVTALLATNAHAQFTNGSLYLGPELGLGLGYGGGIVVGGMIESAITNPGTVGPGRLSIAGRIDYWGWSDGFYTWSFIPFAAYCNYHFVINDPRWDLFAGLGLGYAVVTSSYNGPGSSAISYGGAFITGDIGARYFVSPNVAIRLNMALAIYRSASALTFASNQSLIISCFDLCRECWRRFFSAPRSSLVVERRSNISIARFCENLCWNCKIGAGKRNCSCGRHWRGTITLDHNNIPNVMDAMTMEYYCEPADALQKLKVGDSVSFTLQDRGEGNFVVSAIAPVKK